MTQFFGSDYLFAALLIFFVLFASTIFILWKRIFKRSSTILFVGLSDSGKTSVLYKLVNPGAKWATYSSLKENSFDSWNINSETVKLVDYPGAHPLRKELMEKWLKKAKAIRGIVFVVDSSTYGRMSKDVSEFLYDVICYSKGVPILVACNKQDKDQAKASTLIKSNIEQEFELINASRAVALSTTSGDSSKQLMSESGAKFSWDKLKSRLDFAECSIEESSDFSLDHVRNWIRSL